MIFRRENNDTTSQFRGYFNTSLTQIVYLILIKKRVRLLSDKPFTECCIDKRGVDLFMILISMVFTSLFISGNLILFKIHLFMKTIRCYFILSTPCYSLFSIFI